jgi:hypothetical protein
MSPTPIAVWQDDGSFPGNHVNTRDIPLLLKCDVIAAVRNSCLLVGYLATLRCVIQQRFDMSHYVNVDKYEVWPLPGFPFSVTLPEWRQIQQ